MDVNVVINDAQREIFARFFAPSLSAASTAKLNVFEAPGADGRFMGSGYLSVLIHRMELVVELLAEDTGDLMVWSDIDILFFKKSGDFCEVAAAELGDRPFAFHRESSVNVKEVNSGFFIVRKCKEAKDVFEDVLNRIKRPYNNKFCQFHFNAMIEAGLEVPCLSPRFLTNSYRMQAGWTVLPQDTLLFHGNCTFTPQQKIELLDAFYSSIKNR